jgi:anti-sigma regulatory factor (Ser/Thr protein kinase)
VDARFAQTLRLAASSIATTADFTLEQIEDLKIAVEEAFLMSTEREDGPSQVDFGFRLFGDRMEVRVGELPAGYGDEAPGDGLEQQAYGLMILRAVVDEAQFVTSGDGTQLVMVKLKRKEA